MNLVESSFARNVAHSFKKETPFSGEVEVAGRSISRGDTVEIANKKGEMVRYTVTDIKFDGGPARLLLQSIDSKRKTFKDLDTLAKNPESFRVLINKVDREKAAEAEIAAIAEQSTKQEYANAVEPHLDNMFDSIQSAHREAQYIKKVEQELNNSVSVLKQEADRIDTLRETIARMLTPEQRKQVQAYAEQTKQTSILKHRNGYRFLWDEMQADVLQHHDLLDKNLKADEEIMTMRGFRPMTKEDMTNTAPSNLTDILGTGPKEDIGTTPLDPQEFSNPHLEQASNIERRLREAEFDTAYDRARQPKTYRPTDTNYVGVGRVNPGDIYKVLTGAKKTIYEANPVDGITTRLGVKTSITQQQLLNQTERLRNTMQSNQEQTFFDRIKARAQGFFKRKSTPDTRTGLAIPVTKYQPERPAPKTPAIETIPELPDDAIIPPSKDAPRKQEDSDNYEIAA